MAAAALPIRLILDRLLYASDASDARSSLSQLQERIRRRSSSSTDEQQRDSDILELTGEQTFVSILCQLIINSQLFRNDEEIVGVMQKSPIVVEDGSVLACDLLLNLLASSFSSEEEIYLTSSKRRTSVEYIAAKALLSPPLSTGITSSTVAADLVSSLVDVLTNKTASSHTTYERILSMKLLSRLFTLQPSMTQFSLIHRTPHGLNRLVHLLDVSEEERIRNEILVLLITALSKSTSANTFRQMLLFAEGIDKALQIAVTSEDVGGCGGISTKINEVVILDCTTLIFSILQMGGAAPDILLGSTSSLRALTQLCDGRKGKQFLYKDYSSTNTSDRTTPQRSVPAHQHLSMEDLLSSNVSPDLSLLPGNTKTPKGTILSTPTLTKYEDLIVTSCLKILLFCISSQEEDEEDKNQVQWRKIISRRNIVAGNRELMGIIKCWAFYQPPSSSPRAFVACSPREGTQKVALQILYTLCSRTNSDTTALPLQQQDTINAICDLVERQPPLYNPNTTTDNYLNRPITYKLLDLSLNHPSLVIMAAAISTLRSCLTEEQATIMVLHTLAPPPPSPEEEEAGPVVLPVSPVQTLIDDLANQLLSCHDDPLHIKSTHITRIIQGSAAALGVILHVGGNACKEMLLKIPISFSEVDSEQKNNVQRSQYLLPAIASWLEKCSKSKENHDTVVVSIRSSLIRLICDWSNNCHKVVTDGIFSSLSNPISMVNFLLTEQRDDQNITEMGLAALLLGLWIEYIGDTEHAGWSRSILLNVVQGKIGLSSFTEILASAKEELHSKNFAFSDDVKTNPFWWCCYEPEQRYMYDWFLKNVNVIQRRIVHEITGISDRPESVNDDGTISNNCPFLSTLVEQQASEIEALRRSLREASNNLALTTSECRQWRARCESSFSDADAITEQIEVAIKSQQEAIALRQELDSKDNLLSNLKNVKDAAEQNFQSKLDLLQRENDTIAQENNSMSQELQSLSQAYYNLEEEIRLMKSQCSVESHSQLVGEDQSLATFRYAGVSSDSPREIESLQREVQNLRERLHAADDWMAMAVDRMNAMALENQSLVSNLQQHRNQVQVKDALQQTTEELSSSIDSDAHLLDNMKPEKHILEEGFEILNGNKFEKHILEEEVELPKNENLKAQEWMSKALASNQFLTQQNEEFSIQIDVLNGRIRTLEEEMLNVISDKKLAVDELIVELDSAKSELQIMKGSLENAYSLTELGEVFPNSLQKEINDHEEIIDASAHRKMSNTQIEILNVEIRELKEQLLVAIGEKGNIDKKLAQAESELTLLQAKPEASLPVSRTGNLKAELQEELLELRKSNLEAQEWMSNAVLHHEYLNGEIDSLRVSMANLTTSDDQLRKQVHELASRNKDLMDNITDLNYEKENFMKELKKLTDMDGGETAESLHDFIGCISLVKGMKKKLLHDMKLITEKLESATLSYTEASGLVDSLKEQIFQLGQELDLYRAESSYTSETNSVRVQDFEAERDFQFSSVEHHGIALREEKSKSCLQEQVKDLEDKLITSNKQIKLLLEAECSAKSASLVATEEITNARTECTRISNELKNVNEALTESKIMLAAMEELIEKKNSDLEAEKQKNESLYKEKCLLRENFDQCQNSYKDLELKLETETNKFEESRNEMRVLEERLNLELEMRIANGNSIRILTESIQGYQDSLEMKQEELDRLKREWEEDITASKNLATESQGKLLTLQTKLIRAEELHSESLQNSDLEIKNLRHQLLEKTEAVNKTNEELFSLSTRFDELVRQSSAAVTQWKDRSETLEDTVKEFRSSLRNLEYDAQQLELANQEQLNAANDAIAQWEARCEELTHKIEEVGEQSSGVVNQWKERCEYLELSVDDLKDALHLLESNFQQLERTKDEQLKSANDAITLWENRCVELTSKINDIQESYEVSHAEWLEGTMAELHEAINSLMASNEKLNSEITFVKDLLNSSEMERDLLQQQALTEKTASDNALTQLRENLIQTENLVIELQSQKEELSSTLAVAEEKLMESSQTIVLMQNHKSESDKEHRNFQRIISQLQYELREVYEALQTKVTDELTEMAFEKAPQILNSQLEQFRSKLKDGCEELKKERQGRLAAEHALDKVKHDLSSLFDSGVNFEGSVYENLKAFASNASDCMTRNEKIAIDELSIIIEKTMKELTTSKLGEREAIACLESVQLDLLVERKEKDSLELKLLSMQRSADKARGDNITIMNLLHSRVSNLEGELSRSSRVHTEQINNLKKHISQATIEKEQLLRSLRELEETYSTLVSITTAAKEEEDSNGGEKEIAKLLVEKSELLFAMSDAATKTEQRLRSLVMLQTSTHETELMIERELRRALETSLGEKESELGRINALMIEVEQKNSEAEEKLKNEMNCYKKDIQLLNFNIERLRSDFKSLTKDNSYLKEKLLSLSFSNQKLLDKSRKSEIEVRKLKEMRQFDADIASEIARMKAECVQSSKNQNSSISLGSALDIQNSEPFYDIGSVEAMYSLVLDLRHSVNEERSLHYNLMLEHEDLLAIFSHVDIERSKLQFALATVAGQSAVDDAIREAEESAAIRFGGVMSF